MSPIMRTEHSARALRGRHTFGVMACPELSVQRAVGVCQRAIAGESTSVPTSNARTGIWGLIKVTVTSFIADDVLSKGASIAFYTVTSLAPVLVIVVAIAGLAFGHDAAQGAISAQLSGMMGQQSADLLQTAIKSASGTSSGIIGGLLGAATLIVTASGVFGEMQSSLNMIWKAKPEGGTVSRLLRARAASLGLVAALGFLLLVSLVVSAMLTAFGHYLDAVLPLGQVLLSAVSFVVSFLLITVLFAAIYKVLPDTPIAWRDVMVGSVATALLFIIGKSLIGLYLGSTATGSAYGAAGGLIVMLLWIYYSAQVFLLGAEFTKVYALHRGSKQNVPLASERPLEPPAYRAVATASPRHPEPLSPLVSLLAGVMLVLSVVKAPQRTR